MLGWRRQLLDAVAWAILTNARATAIHRSDLLPEPLAPPLQPTTDTYPATAAPDEPPTIRRWAAWRARTLANSLDRARPAHDHNTPQERS